jgi:peptidylprolyl isomerase
MFLACLQLAACGGSASTASTAEATATGAEEKPAAAKHPEMAYTGDWTVLKRVAGPYAKRLLIPHGPAPTHVVIRDLKIGKGPVLHHGDNYTGRYVDMTYNEMYVVEPYWHEPSTYLFEWGEYRKGWEIGLRGIRVGGIRELIVPSSMAYENGARVYIVQAVKLK